MALMVEASEATMKPVRSAVSERSVDDQAAHWMALMVEASEAMTEMERLAAREAPMASRLTSREDATEWKRTSHCYRRSNRCKARCQT